MTVLVTTRGSSGAVNADSLPTAVLYQNGVANGATVTVTNLAIGIYTVQVTLPTLTFGDILVLLVTATVAGITDNAPVWQDTCDILYGPNSTVKADTVLLNDATFSFGGTVNANVTQVANGAITDASIAFPAESAGRPSTFLAAMRRVWEWVGNQRQRDRSTGNVTLNNAANNAVLETQVQSTSGTVDTETQGH